MLYLLLAFAIIAVILIFLMLPSRGKKLRVESGGGRTLLEQSG